MWIVACLLAYEASREGEQLEASSTPEARENYTTLLLSGTEWSNSSITVLLKYRVDTQLYTLTRQVGHWKIFPDFFTTFPLQVIPVYSRLHHRYIWIHRNRDAFKSHKAARSPIHSCKRYNLPPVYNDLCPWNARIEQIYCPVLSKHGKRASIWETETLEKSVANGRN